MEDTLNGVESLTGLDNANLVMYMMIGLGILFTGCGAWYIQHMLRQVPRKREIYLQKQFLIGCGFMIGSGVIAYSLMMMFFIFDPMLGALAGKALAVLWMIPAAIGLEILGKWHKRNKTDMVKQK